MKIIRICGDLAKAADVPDGTEIPLDAFNEAVIESLRLQYPRRPPFDPLTDVDEFAVIPSRICSGCRYEYPATARVIQCPNCKALQ
jgi:LSD1 subclass zinc finger protein